MNISFTILFAFFFSVLYSQKSHLEIHDKENKPYPSVQIFSNLGNLIGLSNSDGIFEFEKKDLKEMGVKKIILKTDRTDSYEYSLENIPKIVQLNRKDKETEIEEVILTKKLLKFFTAKGYVRSWELKNNQLVKYGEGIVEYHIPYDSLKDKENIKAYPINYRTFTSDSIKKRSPFIEISINPAFFSVKIPEDDPVTTVPKLYKKIIVKDSLYTIEKFGEKIGYLISDKNDKPIEIQISSSFNQDELKDIKIGFWKISTADQTIQKWKNYKKYRYPEYIFNNFKFLTKTKKGIKKDIIEIVTEIFIEDISFSDKKPLNHRYINQFQSYYNTQFWHEQLEKHPLPEKILEQVQSLSENKNMFK